MKLKHQHFRQWTGEGRDRGFALVVSLSLMVLLTVLAVGLLSLSSISLRSSTYGDAMHEARANARVALDCAIAELQRLAGPDQRITAPADIAGTSSGEAAAPGVAPMNNTSVTGKQKGLSMVQPGTRHWTGVWHQTEATSLIYTQTPTPNLLGWLISGNEALSSNDAVTPASTLAAVDGSGKVSDGTKAVVLVGKHSVGEGQVDRYVAAPLVEVASAKGGDQLTGRYAWWVGDEGVKASFHHATPAASDNKMSYETIGQRRAGWEVVNGFVNYPVPGGENADDGGKLVTLAQAQLLDESMAGDAAGGSPVQRSFHAATAHSQGLLVDSFNGGLRVDMTPYLRNGFPNKDATIVPRTVAGASLIKGPLWGRVKEFSDVHKGMIENKLLVKEAANEDGVPIAPTITEFRMLLGARLVPTGESNYKIHPCAKIAIALANPYPYALKWDSALELEITNSQPSGTQGVPGGYRPTCLWQINGQPAFVPATASSPAVFNNAVFTIAPDEIPPGEAKAFTIGSPVIRPVNSTNRVTVQLKPFSSSQPSNFENCVVQEYDQVTSIPAPGGSAAFDVRETWITSQINVELRTSSGEKSMLRRLERFELDNGFFTSTTRVVNGDKAKTMTKPFPLQYYCFQMSQPGNEYDTILPKFSGSPLGLRGSTLRTFTDFNFQGRRFHKPITSYNPPPYFMESADSFANLPFTEPGGDTGSAFTKNLAASPMAWGRDPFTTKKVILFSPQEKFISIAQLQHADLTGDDEFGSVGHQPGNAVGNSYATPFVKRMQTVQRRNNYTLNGHMDDPGAFQTIPMTYYDISYLLNAALWDGYFFSAIPADGDAEPENRALFRVSPAQDPAALRDAKTAAGNLMIAGAFNVNSTSVEAWKALLAGTRHLKHPADGEDASNDALYPRSLEQIHSSTTPPTGAEADSYSGYRRLTDAQLDSLATEIVRQVRLRGPFVSLSHFVNRAIVDITKGRALGRAGALQVALDESGANINLTGTKNAFSEIVPDKDRLNIQANGSVPRADLDGPRPYAYREANPREPVWATSSKDLNPGTIGAILADRPMLTTATMRNEQGYRSSGIPGWITQADILQVIGPAIATRSDTFRIRAYGESLDADGNITARVWCEGIVQRMPEYIDPVNAVVDRAADLSAINETYGRRFDLVAFRWLSKDEI